MKYEHNKKELLQSLKAMYILDIIMTPEENDWSGIINRGFSENVLWYIIDNGGGDELTVLFSGKGILIKGFDHENELNQFAYGDSDNGFFENLFSGMPDELLNLINDDEREYTTFCMWYIYETGQWYENENPENDGGKSYLLGYIHKNFSSFLEWAEEYYESSFVPKIIEKLFLSGNLSYDDILAINPDCKADKIIAEITKGDIL